MEQSLRSRRLKRTLDFNLKGTPRWVALSLVPHGNAMGNKWVCAQCIGKTCSVILSLSEDGPTTCKEG